MAHGNQIRSLLGRHDAGEPGNFQRVALGIFWKRLEHRRFQSDEGAGFRLATSDRFIAHVDHAGFAGMIVMGKLARHGRNILQSFKFRVSSFEYKRTLGNSKVIFRGVQSCDDLQPET